jgi:PhnB protein
VTTRAAFIPVDANQVMPYLTVTDGKRLLDFLVGVFDAAVVRRHEESDGRLAHAAVRIGDSIIELSDASTGWGPTPAALHVYVPDVEATYHKALDHGATSLHAPMDQEYGERSCAVQDPFGNKWYVATPISSP